MGFQRGNHSPVASHDSTRSRVARRRVRVRVESADLVDEAKDRACVDIERSGLTLYGKCAVGDYPVTARILGSSGVQVKNRVVVEQEGGPGR